MHGLIDVIACKEQKIGLIAQIIINLNSYMRRCFHGLRGSLPKSGPLDFATKNSFPLFFVGEEALVGVY